MNHLARVAEPQGFLHRNMASAENGDCLSEMEKGQFFRHVFTPELMEKENNRLCGKIISHIRTEKIQKWQEHDFHRRLFRDYGEKWIKEPKSNISSIQSSVRNAVNQEETASKKTKEPTMDERRLVDMALLYPALSKKESSLTFKMKGVDTPIILVGNDTSYPIYLICAGQHRWLIIWTKSGHYENEDSFFVASAEKAVAELLEEDRPRRSVFKAAASLPIAHSPTSIPAHAPASVSAKVPSISAPVPVKTTSVIQGGSSEKPKTLAKTNASPTVSHESLMGSRVMNNPNIGFYRVKRIDDMNNGDQAKLLTKEWEYRLINMRKHTFWGKVFADCTVRYPKSIGKPDFEGSVEIATLIEWGKVSIFEPYSDMSKSLVVLKVIELASSVKPLANTKPSLMQRIRKWFGR